jgi:predicted DNA-binding transcriptional regulator YafY
MLTPDEIEAAVLGASWVAGRGDPALARAAKDLVAKIGAVIPEHLRPFLIESALTTPERPSRVVADALDMSRVRASIRAQTKIEIDYCDEGDRRTHRTVWPIAVGYFDTVRVIASWCELREDFRSFRTDRVTSVDFLDVRYPGRKALLRAEWRKRAGRSPLGLSAQT